MACYDDPPLAGRFDLVTMIHAYHYKDDIERWKQALQAVHASLRPGGIFLMVYHDKRGPYILARDEMKKKLHLERISDDFPEYEQVRDVAANIFQSLRDLRRDSVFSFDDSPRSAAAIRWYCKLRYDEYWAHYREGVEAVLKQFSDKGNEWKYNMVSHQNIMIGMK
jgi:SAM-dependent methyltransferase